MGNGVLSIKECLVNVTLLKKERIRRRTYPTREAAKSDVFNYIELFYHPTRRHGNNGDLSPIVFEKNYFMNQVGV